MVICGWTIIGILEIYGSEIIARWAYFIDEQRWGKCGVS
jgi:hypothetical protein